MTAQTSGPVIVGVDTHKDSHVAAVIDAASGAVINTATFCAAQAGYRDLSNWANSVGSVVTFAIEGTGCYGAGLTAFLTAQNNQVVEVDRPNRQLRRRFGKSDTADAIAAAHAGRARRRVIIPKDRTGKVEELRHFQATRRLLVKQRTMIRNQITAFAVTAPEDLRTELKTANTDLRLIALAATWPDNADAQRDTISSLITVLSTLRTQISHNATRRDQLVNELCAELVAEPGIGHDSAAELIIAAGQNPDRITNEAAFAALCGVSPVDRSSGNNQHHSLNRGGNRQANRALYTIAMTRMRNHPETLDYLEKRTAQGHTKRDTRRRIQRALARRTYRIIHNSLT